MMSQRLRKDGRVPDAYSDQMSVEEIDALEKEAFRFSGVGALER